MQPAPRRYNVARAKTTRAQPACPRRDFVGTSTRSLLLQRIWHHWLVDSPLLASGDL